MLNQDTVKKYVDALDSMLKVLKWASVLTPTKVDDEIVDKVQEVMDKVKPLVQEQWFIDFVNSLGDMFNKNNTAESLKTIKAALDN